MNTKRSDMLEYRVNGRTGKGTWLTLHEWNVINGYEKPDEIIPYIEIIQGEVVGDEKQKQSTSFSIGARMARLRAVARWCNGGEASQSKREAKPAEQTSSGKHCSDEPTDPTMFEPC